MNKIIRTICYFSDSPDDNTIQYLNQKELFLNNKGYQVQTKRLCSSNIKAVYGLDKQYAGQGLLLSLGSLDLTPAEQLLDGFLSSDNISFNIDLTVREPQLKDLTPLFTIIKQNASKTFNFTYVFNNPLGTPYFPSSSCSSEGYSIGLQPTDLSENCVTLQEWLDKMLFVWNEIHQLLKDDSLFLGIDSSIAPLTTNTGSLINFIKRLGLDFNHSVTTDIYVKITKYIKEHNPKPVGLCGLMFPCLEDFELADEYEKGNFTVERNIFLSLHSGLGVDTYPIGIDEKPERILEIIKLVRGLSLKHNKPLSTRFVSDGKSKIGDKSDFLNQYLKDVVIRPL